MGFSWHEILIVLVVVVLLFGRSKVSELMGDLAHGIKNFKKGMADEPEEAARQPPPVPHQTIKPRQNQGSSGGGRRKTRDT